MASRITPSSAAPGFKCDPEIDGVNSEAAIMIDYEAHLSRHRAALSTHGEIKKSVFSAMNYHHDRHGRSAHALLRQHGSGHRRIRRFLRPVRHRQNHAVR